MTRHMEVASPRVDLERLDGGSRALVSSAGRGGPQESSELLSTCPGGRMTLKVSLSLG